MPLKFDVGEGARVRVVADRMVDGVDADGAAVAGDEAAPGLGAGRRPDRPVVLRAAEEVEERLRRVDGDALELERRQARVDDLQVRRDRLQPALAVRQVGAASGCGRRTADVPSANCAARADHAAVGADDEAVLVRPART